MGKRYFGLSPSTFNRMAQQMRQAKRDQERNALIKTSGGAKEGPTIINIAEIDFNEVTRVAKITFAESKKYRTIERYVTQNYVRYPILSDWKTKRKTVIKTVKLTNETLEKLEFYPDDYISKNAFEIIDCLGKEELYPSWYLRETAEFERKEKSEALRNRVLNERNRHVAILETLTTKNAVAVQELELEITKLKSKQKKISKKEKYLSKATIKKVPIVFSILSLWLLNLHVAIKKKRTIKSLTKLKNKENVIQKKIQNCEATITGIETKIEEENKKHKSVNDDCSNEQRNIEEEYKQILSKITELRESLDENSSSFILIRNLVQFKYTKIVGCYVIKNTINNRCYVGQSKDVMRRLKQHFNGSVPINIIFAEDYYNTPETERDTLFEFMIIKLETKDELDRTERELIIKYDALHSGYNRTSGNT